MAINGKGLGFADWDKFASDSEKATESTYAVGKPIRSLTLDPYEVSNEKRNTKDLYNSDVKEAVAKTDALRANKRINAIFIDPTLGDIYRQQSNGAVKSIIRKSSDTVEFKLTYVIDGKEITRSVHSATAFAWFIHKGSYPVKKVERIDTERGYQADNLQYILNDKDAVNTMLVLPCGDTISVWGLYQSSRFEKWNQSGGKQPSHNAMGISFDEMRSKNIAIPELEQGQHFIGNKQLRALEFKADVILARNGGFVPYGMIRPAMRGYSVGNKAVTAKRQKKGRGKA